VSEPIELVVVEDDPKTMKNLLRLLSAFEEFRVVGNALSGEAGVEAITALQPHLALLDLELPDMNGIEVTARVKAARPQTEVLILTSFEDEVKVYQAIQAGASGYLVKSLAPPRLRQAILDVLAGGTVIEPRLARRFWNYFQSVQGKPQGETLTLEELERDILTMIARGLTNQEAGKVLQLERRTVRTHLGHIYQKLGTTSRAEAVVIALRKGLIQL
jgi:DNA-binding NarL/FixJ family response regulator